MSNNDHPDFSKIVDQFEAHDQAAEFIIGLYRSIKNRLLHEGMPQDFADEASKEFVLMAIRSQFQGTNPKATDD